MASAILITAMAHAIDIYGQCHSLMIMNEDIEDGYGYDAISSMANAILIYEEWLNDEKGDCHQQLLIKN